MINRKQLTFIASAIVLTCVLLSMDIKGLVKPKEARNGVGPMQQQEAPTATVTLEQVSERAKLELTGNLASQIAALEEQLKTAPAAQKAALQQQLAEKWDDVDQPAPSAFYYESLAAKINTLALWMKAGDAYTAAYQNTADTLSQPALVQKAIGAYQKALELAPENLDAKTGLGIAYVSGTGAPMQGIALLKSVVTADPRNLKANMNLGLFSMRSGQFDKAVERFKTVISIQPDAESWFYLASSYENLGKNTDAIAAYEKSKELAADPGLSNFVDKKIAELKK